MNTATAPILTEEYRRLLLDQVQESKTNPRRHFDKVADAELAASIKSKVAGKPDIPAVIRNYSDTEAMEVQIIENLQRKDVHPMDEAFGFQQLLAQRDDKKRPLYDVPAIAGKVGKSVSYVYMRLKLMDLVDKAQEALWEDKITAGHAEKIARLQPKQQAEALKQCTAYDVSVRDLAEWIERTVHLDLVKAPFDPKDAALVPSAKACITCPKRAGTQPDLFADITKADTCTDPGCFNTKVAAHYAQRKSALTKEGLKVIEATSDHYSSKKNVISIYKLTRAGNIKCEDIGAALIVDGKDRGSDVRICTNEKCKKHHPPATKSQSSSSARAAGRGKPSPSNAGVDLAKRHKETAEQMADARAVDAVLTGFRKKPTLAVQDLTYLAHAMVWNIEATDQQFAVLCKFLGVKPVKRHHAGYTAAIELATKSCKSLSRAAEIVFGMLVLDIFTLSYGERLVTKQGLAKRFGTDLPKLQAKILGELKAKDKALAEAAKKAKAAKLQTSAKPKKKAATTGAKRKPKGKKRG